MSLLSMLNSVLSGCICCASLLLYTPAVGQFQQSLHQPLSADVTPVSAPGCYARPGTTYLLTNDITHPMTPIFLGKDVTLDLNGYTIRFADASYEHMPNRGFEEGVKGWDLSKAPGAKVVDTEEVHVFIGKKIMSLKAGDEIVSPYITLPVANRSYFAMCGVTGFDYHDMGGDLRNQMKVSVHVDDEQGNEVRMTTTYADTTITSVPVERRSPRLGGGFVYAHLHNLPAGKYRVRVKAETDCLIDEVDIRPAMDAGIGIVGKTDPTGHYDHLYEGVHAAFFDHTKDVATRLPLDSIPQVKGAGTITIRNGTIENATEGVVSWGIQSTAEKVRIILDNVNIKNSGINATAVDVPQASVTHCKFEVENPFLVNRHGSSFYAVDLRGDAPSEVSYSEFFGGQGCLVFKGRKSSIHHNYFVNKQMVTNHYSIMAMGDSSHIFENRIEPETGSGIEIYIHKYIEIFNNLIKIKTSPPTCEYGHDQYSTAAVRIADYLAKPGSPRGCYGNRVYNNRIHVSAVGQIGVASYVPMAWAIYYSASGGDNDVFGNEINIHREDSGNAISTAFYISGGLDGFGGSFYNNTIRTNVPAAWIGTTYGGAVNSRLFNNTIIRSENARSDFKPIRIGSLEGDDHIARNVEFRSNEIIGAAFDVEATDQHHTYKVYWTLNVTTSDTEGRPLPNRHIVIYDRSGNESYAGVTGSDGSLKCELPQYFVDGSQRKFFAPYTVRAGKIDRKITLDKNTDIRLTLAKNRR